MSIRVQVCLGILLVVGSGFYWFLNWMVEDLTPQYRTSTEEPLVDTARILAAMAAMTAHEGRVDYGLFGATFDEVSRHAFAARIYDFVKTHVDFRLYITDAQGIVRFDSDRDPTTGRGRDEGQDYSQWRDVRLTWRGEYGARTSRTIADDALSSVMYVAAPIIVDGHTIGVLSLGKPTRNVNTLVASAKRKILLAGTATGVAIVAVGLLLSSMTLRPMHRLTTYARAVRDGQRLPLPPLGRSEIATLGQAFEAMRDALEGKQYIEHYVQTLTHEMKSPLAAIHGAAELLQEETMLPGQRQRFVHNIQSEAQRLLTIVEKLLLLAAVENCKALQAVARLNLWTLATAVRESFDAVLLAKRITCTIHGTPDATFPGDDFFVRQALANLLQNAVQFTPQGGTIRLTVNADAATVSLVVQDSGPGIPPYALGRVFERFYSLPHPDTGKKSSGLGLSLVREVAVLHAGTVTLHNHAEGGAVACLSFPRTLTHV